MAKKLVGVDIGSYVFDASEKTITFSELTGLSLEQILVITNVTDNIDIYNFIDTGKGGSLASSVLTLTYDTTLMSDTDDLQIWVWYEKDIIGVSDTSDTPIDPAKENGNLFDIKNNTDKFNFENSRLLTDSIVAMDTKPDNWFEIVTAPKDGDVLKIKIIDKPEIVIPFDSTQEDNKLETAVKIVSWFNGHPDYNTIWTSSYFKEDVSMYIYITALSEGKIGERSPANSFYTTDIGTIETLAEYDNIIARKKILTLGRDSTDPRKGLLVICDGWSKIDGTSYVSENLKNGSNYDMNVDGSGTPVDFGIYAEANYDIYIKELRLYGSDSNNIQMSNFLGSPALTNGLQLIIQSLGVYRDDVCNIKKTGDIQNKFAAPMNNFKLFNEGKDNIVASFIFDSPLVIKRSGSYAYSDGITFRVRDNLTGIDELGCFVHGYKLYVGG